VTRDLRRPRSWAPVVNEVLLAAGPVPVDPGPRPDGVDSGYSIAVDAFLDQAGPELTWSETVIAGAFLAAGQTDLASLRTALVTLAGQATAWIYDIDARLHPNPYEAA
jgi:hypothetical protein